MASKRINVGVLDNNTKKLKCEENADDYKNEIKESFDGVTSVAVLNDKTSQKVAVIHGKFEGQHENDAVIILERKPFDVTAGALAKLFSPKTKLTIDLKNDIYGTYNARLPPELCDIKATVIYPATQKHLDKYKKQNIVLVTETSQDYYEVVEPFLEKQFQNNVFNIQWVYNILEHQKETERIVFEDSDPMTGFILLPDMKWDGKDAKCLYVIAIPHRHGIKSLRDLTAEHIPLLQNIASKSTAAISEKFDIDKDHLRMYFHYQPSYYHLHIHINHLDLDIPGTGALRAHMLQDVIDNLQLAADYYQKKMLQYTLPDSDKLMLELKAAKN